MREVIGLLLLASSVSAVALGLLFYGLVKHRQRAIYAAGAGLLLGGLLASGAFFLAGKKTYRRAAEAVRPRSGEEIYTALFGPAQPGCVRVLHYQDQVVPRLDCCIWLEFSTCPAEIKRIIAADSGFHAISQPIASSYCDTLGYSPGPAWWHPVRIGRAALFRRKFRLDNPNRDQLLIFSSDSTHAYYYNMAD